MGGPTEVLLERTPAEITARLIEIGRTPLPNPHTVWVVEDPSPNGPFYRDRSELDNICYTLPVGHLEKFPFPTTRLVQANITFYPYKYRQEALEDAKSRVARVVKTETKMLKLFRRPQWLTPSLEDTLLWLSASQRIVQIVAFNIGLWACNLTIYTTLFFVLGVEHLTPAHAVALCLLGAFSLGMLTASITKMWARWRS